MRKSETLIALVSLVLFLNSGIAYSQGPPVATPEHKALAREVGEWKAESRFWPTPGSEPLESEGTEKCSLLGELWMVSEYKGLMFGTEYKGLGTLGYDPIAKKYVGTYIDSMMPFLNTMEGEYDVQTHTLTMVTTGRNPMTGKIETSKAVTRYIDDDTKVFEMHAAVPGKEGEYVKQLEIRYKRIK